MMLKMKEFATLSILFEGSATTPSTAMAIREIYEAAPCCSCSTYRNCILALKELGYVEVGMMNGNAVTYFINEAGKRRIGK